VEVVKDNKQVLHLFLVQVQQEVQVVEIQILEILVCVDKVFLVVGLEMVLVVVELQLLEVILLQVQLQVEMVEQEQILFLPLQ
jgi:hypothetical protein